MACAANQLLVSGVTSYPNANGVYTALDPVVYGGFIVSYGDPGLNMWVKRVGSEGYLIYQAAGSGYIDWYLSVYTGIPDEVTDWQIIADNYYDSDITNSLFGSLAYPEDEDVCPEGVTWTNGVTIVSYSGAPSQNTFGLPAEVVALITSRFGSVARFLRLRNQGQV